MADRGVDGWRSKCNYNGKIREMRAGKMMLWVALFQQ
jgi:hypothetical protein